MSNKTNEPPDLAKVLAAHATMTDALARLPDARNRADRDEIHGAIGPSHRTLMEAASYRDTPDKETMTRLLTRGKGLDMVLDYVAARVIQIPDMAGSRAMAMAHTLELGHEGLRALSALVHLAGGDATAELSGHLKAMSEEAKQAADGWRVKQPPYDEEEDNRRMNEHCESAAAHMATDENGN